MAPPVHVTIAPLRPSAWAGMPCPPYVELCFALYRLRCRRYGHKVQCR